MAEVTLFSRQKRWTFTAKRKMFASTYSNMYQVKVMFKLWRLVLTSLWYKVMLRPDLYRVGFRQWRQFTNFLGVGKFFYGIGEIFFCAVMPKAPYQHPLLKSIHVLKCTKAWYACTYIEHWINETNKKNWGILGATAPSQPPPIGATGFRVIDRVI